MPGVNSQGQREVSCSRILLWQKPAHGKLTAKINPTLTAIDEAINELAQKGRCLLAICAEFTINKGSIARVPFRLVHCQSKCD